MRRRSAFIIAAAVLSLTMNFPAHAEETKEWMIVTDTVFEPFEFVNTSGEFAGIDVDILSAIAEDQGFAFQLNSVGWNEAIAACRDGKADGMIAGASATEQRKEDGWIFSDGYYMASQSMVVGETSAFHSFEDLKDQLVGVKSDTESALYAERIQDRYGFQVIYFADAPTMYQAVMDEQIAACFEDTPIMAATILDQELPLKIVTGTENEGIPYGFVVFSKEKQELLDSFNQGLKNIMANGTYEEIITKYLGEDAARQAIAAFAPEQLATELPTE